MKRFGARRTAFGLDLLHVLADHFRHQIGYRRRGHPAEFLPRLAGVPEQEFNLGRTKVTGIDLDKRASRFHANTLLFDPGAAPFQHDPQFGERPFHKRSDRISHPRGEDEIVGLGLAASSATCLRQSRARGPSRASRRDCRDRGAPETPGGSPPLRA